MSQWMSDPKMIVLFYPSVSFLTVQQWRGGGWSDTFSA